MALEITILGANSAIPVGSRNPTSQVIDVNQHLYLIDCGEGTQNQLRRNKVKMQRIKAIFISHLHGDHYFGLFGLLGSMSLLGRTVPLTIVCTKGLQQLIELQMKLSFLTYDFEIQYVDINHKQSSRVYADDVIEVDTIPLKHRIPTSGFLIKEKPAARKLKPFAITEYNIPISERNAIKNGADFTDESGCVHANASITENGPKVWSYAFCSDTKYTESILPLIHGADVLYHEATFLKAEIKRAKQTMHSTTHQAAQIAKLANVGELIIGHYSARYKRLEEHLDEAKSVFRKTKLAIEGKKYSYR